MIANAPGSVADVVSDEHRALAFSFFSIGPLNGPVYGPIIGGFTSQYLGWRWTNWLALILSGVAWILMASVKETYAPQILRRKAKKMRKETGDSRWWSRYDASADLWSLLKLNLSRPFILMFTEPIWYVGILNVAH
jgi:MFS family permease